MKYYSFLTLRFLLVLISFIAFKVPIETIEQSGPNNGKKTASLCSLGKYACCTISF